MVLDEHNILKIKKVTKNLLILNQMTHLAVKKKRYLLEKKQKNRSGDADIRALKPLSFTLNNY